MSEYMWKISIWVIDSYDEAKDFCIYETVEDGSDEAQDLVNKFAELIGPADSDKFSIKVSLISLDTSRKYVNSILNQYR